MTYRIVTILNKKSNLMHKTFWLILGISSIGYHYGCHYWVVRDSTFPEGKGKEDHYDSYSSCISANHFLQPVYQDMLQNVVKLLN